MKTILDAVNENEGKWPYGLGIKCMIICTRSFANYVIGDFSNYSRNEFSGLDSVSWSAFCTRDEFNQYVEDCSNNKGWENIMNNTKFEFHNNSRANTITSNNILCCAQTGRVVAVFYNESDLQAATGLIKKVDLIDGECYQFNSPSGGFHKGYYIPVKKLFVSHRGNFDAHRCTNIQLLEVK